MGLDKVGWVNGLGQDWSVVLDSFSIFLYLGVCASIVTHCSNSYGSIFISDVDKKMSNIISLSKKWIKENQKYWWRFVVFLHKVTPSLVSKLRLKVDQKAISDVNHENVNYERAKKDKWERDLTTWESLRKNN